MFASPKASALQHEEFIEFVISPDFQQVSCMSVSINEDMVYSPGRIFLISFEGDERRDRFEGPTEITIEIVENGENQLLQSNVHFGRIYINFVSPI